MKFTDFLLTVSKMRDAQRTFYANRTQSNLIEAKTREKDVDQAIRAATAEMSEIEDTRQGDLFADAAIDEAIRTTAQRRTDPFAHGDTMDERLERSHD
jgi:hypothetical protein